MRENPRLYAGYSKVHFKNDARNRGPSPGSPKFETVLNFEARKSPALPLDNSAITATLAMHQVWARNWCTWNRYCPTALTLACPFYLFPLEFMQQYFSYIFGIFGCSCPQWPMAARRTGQQLHRQAGDGGKDQSEWLDLDADGQSEEAQRAMDAATGASTELWFEIIHEESSPAQPQARQQRERERERELALAGAA